MSWLFRLPRPPVCVSLQALEALAKSSTAIGIHALRKMSQNESVTACLLWVNRRPSRSMTPQVWLEQVLPYTIVADWNTRNYGRWPQKIVYLLIHWLLGLVLRCAR